MAPRTAIYCAAVVLAVLWLQPTVQSSCSAGQLSPEAIEGATTAAEHEALAEAYDKLAADARAMAEKHRRMRAAYGRATSRKGPGVTGGAMKFHCGQLITRYDEAAAEAEMLADLHRQLAAKAKQKEVEEK